MRLNAFFMKPTAAPTPANNSETTGVPEEEGNEEPKHVLSDYEKEFPPFFVHPHMTLAPANRFHRDPDSMKHACEKLDEALHDSATASTTPPTTTTMTDHPPAPATKPKKIFDMLPYRRRRNLQRTPCAKELIMSMQDPSSNTVDLTAASRQLEETLKKIPMKFLSYYEDVRPPYTGTFTRRIPPSDAAKLCRNPFGRLIPQVDYDYDSEAEWEDPEEGEDLDSDDGDEEVDDEDDDMDGFLDDGDEDVPSGKRKIMVDSLEPVCSGLRFESDEQDSNGVDPVFENHQLEIIGGALPCGKCLFNHIFGITDAVTIKMKSNSQSTPSRPLTGKNQRFPRESTLTKPMSQVVYHQTYFRRQRQSRHHQVAIACSHTLGN